jgi:macrolide-specific efflux system membrane fusion protein
MNVQNRIPQIDAAAPRLRPRKRGKGGRLSVIAVLVMLSAGGGYYYYVTSNDASAKPVVITAQRGDIEDVVTAVGNLTPVTTVDVGAQVSGQLTNFHVQIGSEVKKGDLLAEIDSSVMSAKVDADKAQLQNFQSQLAEKQSQLALTQLQADRQQRLMRDNATSQDALDTATAAAKVADAQVKSVQAQINQSESQLKADSALLSYSKIFAPMTGTVSAMPVKEGQTLNANQTTPTVLTISDLTTMTVSTQVSEADVSKLRLGMEAYFTTLGNATRRFRGTLRQILPTPTVTNNVVLYTALFDVSNADRQLMTQMTAQVFFVRAAARDVVTVPVAALRFSGPGQAGARQNPGAQGAAAPGQGARAGRNGGGGGGAGRRGGRGGQFAGGGAALEQDGSVKPRPATVTVVKDDGTQEVRDVMVGVTDRVNAAILSGLSEGEKVAAGTQQADAGDGRPRGGQAGGFRPPGAPPLGGFR